jgi:hypothetical protein
VPQPWLDDLAAKTGVYSLEFVWCYDEATVWGEPYPLTMEAFKLLIKYERMGGNSGVLIK